MNLDNQFFCENCNKEIIIIDYQICDICYKLFGECCEEDNIIECKECFNFFCKNCKSNIDEICIKCKDKDFI